MPPRRGGPGRPPNKVSRMAAAVEAMSEMGFEPKLVRKKVNRLLKNDIYGEDGWRFIEESSYSVLLEALLEEQTNGDENVGNASPENSKNRNYAETAGAGPSSSKDVSSKKSCCGNNSETSGGGILSKDLSAQTEVRCVNDTESLRAGPFINEVASAENDLSGGGEVETSEPVTSSRKVLFPCSNLEAVNKTLQSKDKLDSASHNEALNKSPPTEFPDVDNLLLPTEETQGILPTEVETQGILPTEVETQGQEGIPVTHSAQQVDTLPTRRRRPYYGWVGCEDDDFVVLTEAPLPEVLRKMFILNVDSGKRKRKSRWDVRPEDM